MGGNQATVELLDQNPDDGIVGWCWKAQIELMADFVRWIDEAPMDEEPAEDEGREAEGRALRRGSLPPDAKEELGAMARMFPVNRVLAATVAPRLTMRGRGRSFRFRVEPASLLGALWLQAAQAAEEGVTVRQCLDCGRPIAIAPRTGARTDTKFCSDACKSRNYRRRQTHARELAGRGWKPGRIAKEVHSTAATVRAWIR